MRYLVPLNITTFLPLSPLAARWERATGADNFHNCDANVHQNVSFACSPTLLEKPERVAPSMLGQGAKRSRSC